jgi:hypothetical protein
MQVRLAGAMLALCSAALVAQAQTPAPAPPSAPAQLPPVATAPVIVDDQLRARIAQGGLAFGVPVSVAAASRQAGGPAQIQLAFEASVPIRTPRPLTVMFGLVDRSGRLLNAGRRVVSETADTDDGRLTFAIPMTPGLYRLRVAVADAVGRIGAAEIDIAGYLTQMGGLRVSDVLLAWARADGKFRFLGLPDAPSGAKSVRVSLELYADPAQTPAAPHAWAVQFTLTGEHDTKPVFDQQAAATGTATAVAASVVMPLEKLGPGTYTLRAAVTDGTTALGSVSRQLHIE